MEARSQKVTWHVFNWTMPAVLWCMFMYHGWLIYVSDESYSYKQSWLGQKLTWPEVTKMKIRKTHGCMVSLQYIILNVSKHSDKNCAHSTILKFEAGHGVHIWRWPDLVTWPFDLRGQNLHTRCIVKLCEGTLTRVPLMYMCNAAKLMGWFSKFRRRLIALSKLSSET